MKGLEATYYSLDDERKRLARLLEMERIAPGVGWRIHKSLLLLLDQVNNAIEEGHTGEVEEEEEVESIERPR